MDSRPPPKEPRQSEIPVAVSSPDYARELRLCGRRRRNRAPPTKATNTMSTNIARRNAFRIHERMAEPAFRWEFYPHPSWATVAVIARADRIEPDVAKKGEGEEDEPTFLMQGRDGLLLSAYPTWVRCSSDIDTSALRNRASLRVRYSSMTTCIRGLVVFGHVMSDVCSQGAAKISQLTSEEASFCDDRLYGHPRLTACPLDESRQRGITARSYRPDCIART
jgi:hypothetical protein